MPLGEGTYEIACSYLNPFEGDQTKPMQKGIQRRSTGLYPK